ncbi:hypothetical protein [Microbacterium sp. CH12i]|uniref:hypothetical protein n=1 Tax=Microbacterium sp. CH12i TaxID=1479651 RepID=UPI000AA7D586
MRIDTQAQRVIWSASDLKAAAECEFAWARAIDAKLGRVPKVEEPEDATLARAAKLGDVHEVRVLESYRERFGADAVHEVSKVSSADASSLAAVVEESLAALRSDARVVFQAAFSTEEFVGFADFLLREDDGRWRVQDSKLARTARVTALMQLAAYVDQLDGLGIPRSDEVDLILGDGTISTHAVDDLLPLFHVRRAACAPSSRIGGFKTVQPGRRWRGATIGVTSTSPRAADARRAPSRSTHPVTC